MASRIYHEVFQVEKPLIGMIHVPALPGTPGNKLNPKEIISKCLKEAMKLKDGGIDGIMIENMHDIPYLKRNVGPEIVGLLSVVGHEVKKASSLPCGIQILAGANKEALAAALAGGLDFIRAEGFVFGHLADEGYMDADAGELLRFRKFIGAEHIFIFTDIKKKHSSHAITQDVSITETAKSAEFFLSDGIVITGKFTGKEPELGSVKDVREATKLPVLIGSGITEENIEKYFRFADGFIVGSSIKYDGNWENDIDPERLSLIVKKVKLLRKEI